MNSTLLSFEMVSCIFCIFAPFDALVIAGIHNYELLCEYVEVESEINHWFTNDFPISDVKDAIDLGYVPKGTDNWIM